MDGKQQKIKLISVQLYIITLDIKGLNAQIKRDSINNIKKDTTICCAQETHFEYKTN